MDTDDLWTDSAPGRTPRALVVSDDGLARAGIAGQLGSMALRGAVGTRDDVTAAVRSSGADVVVWDLGTDPRRLSEGIADLESLGVPVVALLPEDTWAAETLAAGARGLLPREAGAAALRAAVEAAARGLVVMDPALARALPRATGTVGAGGARGAPADELTAREVEVLQRLAEGLPNKLIAHRLGISEHTVKFHVNAILVKLGVGSRTEAVVRAARLGLVML